MATFDARLAEAATLGTPFVDTFNAHCSTHRIVKFGIENTPLRGSHGYIRNSRDQTSQFVRYLPDSVLVRLDDVIEIGQVVGPKVSLVEFKVSLTPVRTTSLFRRIQSDYGDGPLPLSSPEQIFDVERDALNLYRAIAGLGVSLIVVAWQRHSLPGLIKAQYANDIVVCNEVVPGGGGRGSGTPVANTHFGSYRGITEFFEQECAIAPSVLEAVVSEVVTTAQDGTDI